MKLAVSRFKGAAPKIPPRFLPEDTAQTALDVEAVGASVKPLNGVGSSVATLLTHKPKTLYRFRQNDLGATPQWFAWAGEVDVVRSQIAGDANEWTFYTGDGSPRATNKNMATNSGGPPAGSIPLGVQPPEAAPTLAAMEYEFETEPATLYIDLGTIGLFTTRFGLKISLDGGKTFTDVALTGDITAESVAAALDAVDGVTATVVGGGVEVKTEAGGRGVSIHIKYAEDDYTTKSGKGYDFFPPKIRIYKATLDLYASWNADEERPLVTTVWLYNAEVWRREWPKRTFSAKAFSDALGTIEGVVSGDAGGGDIYVETKHPHVGKGAYLGVNAWQQGYPSNFHGDGANGTDPHYAEVTLTGSDLAYLNGEDDIQYSIDGGNNYTSLQVSNTSAASVAALFDAELYLNAVTDGGNVAVKTTAVGYNNPDPKSWPYRPVTLHIRYRSSRANILSATGKTLDTLNKETRVYAYTWVSIKDDWERESAPSPASESIDVYPKQGVKVTRPAAPVKSQVTHWRLYRSVKGTYLFVGEATVGTKTLDDTLEAAGLGEEMPSMTWTPPPDDLKGLINLPNGMMAGFVGRDLYFCDPYHPHAWPENYSQTIDYPVVGLGRMDTTLAVLTTGVPYIIQGSHPDSLVAVKSDLEQACVSKRSIVSMNNSVFYASPDGLVRLSPSGSELVTANILTQAQWRDLKPELIHAYSWDGKYMAFHGDRSGGFIFDTREGQLYNHSITQVFAAYADLQSDRLYAVATFGTQTESSVHPWGEGTPWTGTWRSKRFTLPQIAGFSCMQVEAESYPADKPIVVEVLADQRLILKHTVRNRLPFRLPAIQAREWEFKLTVTVEVFNVIIAQSMSEIASG